MDNNKAVEKLQLLRKKHTNILSKTAYLQSTKNKWTQACK